VQRGVAKKSDGSRYNRCIGVGTQPSKKKVLVMAMRDVGLRDRISSDSDQIKLGSFFCGKVLQAGR